jgi:serine/threonine-protein kinase HipA
MEDFAQVFGEFPNDRYKRPSDANITAVVWAEAGEDAAWEFTRRPVFSVVIGNADMHLKNCFLLYPDQRTPALAPAYDFVATLAYLPNDAFGLSFGGSRSLAEITPDQMRRFADAARIPASPLLQITIERAERTAQAWKGLERADLPTKDLRDSIQKQILKVAAAVKGPEFPGGHIDYNSVCDDTGSKYHPEYMMTTCLRRPFQSDPVLWQQTILEVLHSVFADGRLHSGK